MVYYRYEHDVRSEQFFALSIAATRYYEILYHLPRHTVKLAGPGQSFPCLRLSMHAAHDAVDRYLEKYAAEPRDLVDAVMELEGAGFVQFIDPDAN